MVMEVEVELHNVQIIFAQTKRLCDKKEEVWCVCTSLTVMRYIFYLARVSSGYDCLTVLYK